ncbi:hypothetical protein MACJ_003999 [Theileria orientalis]|uniref:Uncharacterized protein n=1 Tax=Theileria orientalis TaxID=68886 RepID=A0A976SL06_THEOR|nr:hypothetical protein MACJ_003999 [Theileria orientalis]
MCDILQISINLSPSPFNFRQSKNVDLINYIRIITTISCPVSYECLQFRFAANFREAHPSMKQRIDTYRRKNFDENMCQIINCGKCLV